MELYRLTDSCQYRNLKHEMIHDRLVSIHNDTFSQQLQLYPELTLNKAKKRIRQREAMDEQQKQLKGAVGETNNFKELRTRKPPGGKGPNLLKGHNSKTKSQTTKTRTQCGKSLHPRDNCHTKMSYVTGATRKVTTTHSVSLSRSLQSLVMAYLLQRFWTHSLANIHVPLLGFAHKS